MKKLQLKAVPAIIVGSFVSVQQAMAVPPDISVLTASAADAETMATGLFTSFVPVMTAIALLGVALSIGIKYIKRTKSAA